MENFLLRPTPRAVRWPWEANSPTPQRHGEPEMRDPSGGAIIKSSQSKNPLSSNTKTTPHMRQLGANCMNEHRTCSKSFTTGARPDVA